MATLFFNHWGMNIVGQGGLIMLFTLPSLGAAILLHLYLPELSSLPLGMGFLAYAGYLLLVPGLLLWISAVIQLLIGFPKGRLITTGAYRIVRNPIYSSVAFFVLPAVAMITLAWPYLMVSVFLYGGVTLFIRKEEQQLAKAFGKDYDDYTKKVHRIIPFRRPGQ